MTFTGDILIQETENGFDINYINGQPEMTDGFETSVILAVFSDSENWQNGIAKNQNEKYISKFSNVIERAVVSDETKNNGIQEIKKALQYLVDIKAVKSINVIGIILSVYSIGWSIEIERLNGNTAIYNINWTKGVLTAGGNNGNS